MNNYSMESDYRLDNQGSIPGTGKEFAPLAGVQPSSEAHPASQPMETSMSAMTSTGLLFKNAQCMGFSTASVKLADLTHIQKPVKNNSIWGP
jgi:hypothetical protein